MSTENQSKEVTARTVDEAIQVGLSELGVGLDEVVVDVLDRGRPGILGVGATRARVRLTLRSGPAQAGEIDPPAFARETLATLLTKMGITADIFIVSEEGEEPIALDVRGEDAGILIGRQGRSLGDLQVMLNVLVSRRTQERIPITVDVEGYKERRFEKVRSLAFRAADRVRRSGHPVSMEPMSPAERRVVHVALAENRSVSTQSEGTGPTRHIVIFPRREGNPPARPSFRPQGRPGDRANRPADRPDRPVNGPPDGDTDSPDDDPDDN